MAVADSQALDNGLHISSFGRSIQMGDLFSPVDLNCERLDLVRDPRVHRHLKPRVRLTDPQPAADIDSRPGS